MKIDTMDPSAFRRVRLDGSAAGEGLEFLPSQRVLQEWNPNVRLAAEDDENSISIFDAIGPGFLSPGVTAKSIDAILRHIGRDKDVTVNINSPGGMMFEGFAIYNLLRNHRGAIKVNVLGIAASAASVIAMAGDEIVMNRGAQMMVHNPAACACGDYRFFERTSTTLKGFRDSALEIYEARTQLPAAKLRKMLDDETFMTAQAAVDNGFADAVSEIPTREEDNTNVRTKSLRAKNMEILKVALARDEITREERSAIFKELGLVASVTDEDPSAASVTGSPEGDAELLASLRNLATTMKG